MSYLCRVLIAGPESETERSQDYGLAAAGCEVLEGRGEADIVHAACRVKPEMVLLNVVVEGPDPFETMKRLKKNPDMEQTPVILLIDGGDAECAVSGFDLGADDCLTKPVDRKELLARIMAVMRRSEAVRAYQAHAEALFHQATTEPLTGLYNRWYLKPTVERYLACLKRYDRPYSLLILDIDDFSIINKRLGSLYGNGILKAFSDIIKSRLRAGDVAARYCNEKFVVVLSDTRLEGALVAAERLRRLVEDHPFPDVASGAITASVGVAEFRKEDCGMDDIVKRANDALYAAKRTGQNKGPGV